MFEEALLTHSESDLYKRNVTETKEMIEERKKEEERPKRMKEAYFKKQSRGIRKFYLCCIHGKKMSCLI